MIPVRRNDFAEEEQKLIRLYGVKPKKNPLMKMKDRKYFDSGDYALSKAGKAPQSTVGTAIPNPENIPHATSSNANNHSLFVSPSNTASSPIKESPLAEPEGTTSTEESESRPDEAAGRTAETAPDTATAVPSEEPGEDVETAAAVVSEETKPLDS